jgi:hypothetical protein
MNIEDECGRLKRNMSPMFPDSFVTYLPDRSSRHFRFLIIQVSSFILSS